MESSAVPRVAPARSAEYERALEESVRYAEQFDRSRLGPAPLASLIVVTCMDARIEVEALLGLRPGDANVIRNAGGLATDDVLRSIILSQQLLATEEILVIGHTGCALNGLPEDDLRARLAHETGRRQPIQFGSFPDLAANVRAQVERIRAHPWTRPVPVHGLIYDVATGRLDEVV